MVKQVGLALAALPVAGAGVWRAIRLYRQTKLTVSMSAFAEAIRAGVCRYAWDQKTIYESFRDRFLEEQGFLPRLREETERRPWGALYRASEAFLKEREGTKEIREIFLSFAREFGTLGMAEQASACEACAGRLKELAEIRQKRSADEIRLSLTAGFAGACGILILFW